MSMACIATSALLVILQAVVEHTDEAHADWPRLTAALRKIQAEVDLVNDRKREYERKQV